MNKSKILDKLNELEFLDAKIEEIGEPVKTSEYIGLVAFSLLMISPFPCFLYFSEEGFYEPFFFLITMCITGLGALFFFSLLSLLNEEKYKFYKNDETYYNKWDYKRMSELRKYINIQKVHPKNISELLRKAKIGIESEMEDEETIESMISLFKEDSEIKNRHKDVLIRSVKSYEEKLEKEKEEDRDINLALSKAGFETFEKKENEKIFKINEVYEHE